MELSPSQEVASCAATEELSQHFMEPEGSLPYSKSPPLVIILSQMNFVHTPIHIR
jgi:hypothetical protein